MSKGIDKKDKKLLYYLSRDGRMPQTRLASNVALSKNGVKYRIDRLQERGYIRYFTAVINLTLLGYSTFTALMRFNADIYENEALLDAVTEHPYVDSVTTLSGHWDVFAEFVYEDIPHAQRIIDGFREEFGADLNRVEPSFSNEILTVDHLPEAFYDDLDVEEREQPQRATETYDVDAVDRQILRTLTRDGRISYADLAEEVGTSLDTVRYRVNNMEDAGVIYRYFPEVDLAKFGYTSYLFTVTLEDADHATVENLKNTVQAHPHVTYAFYDALHQEVTFLAAYREPAAVDRLSRQLRKRYREIIDTQEYVIATENVVFDLFPPGLQEA